MLNFCAPCIKVSRDLDQHYNTINAPPAPYVEVSGDTSLCDAEIPYVEVIRDT